MDTSSPATLFLLLQLIWSIPIQPKLSKTTWKSPQHSSPRTMESKRKVRQIANKINIWWFIYSNETMSSKFLLQFMSSRIRSLGIQSIRLALCSLRSWWEIFRWKMVSFTWFIVLWWLLIRLLPNSSRYVNVTFRLLSHLSGNFYRLTFIIWIRINILILFDGVECEHFRTTRISYFCKFFLFLHPLNVEG